MFVIHYSTLDTTIVLIMTLLIMTLLLMTILKALNTGDTT
jgi:hypothetical protein